MKLRRLCFSFFLLFVSGLFSICQGQIKSTNTLLKELEYLKHKRNYLADTVYLKTINILGLQYADTYPDSALILLKNQAKDCRNIGYKAGEVYAYINMGNAFETKGDVKNALENYNKAYASSKKYDLTGNLAPVLNNIGIIYSNQGNYIESLNKYYEALTLAQASKNKSLIGSIVNNIALVHFYQGKMKEADSAYKITLKLAFELKDSVRVSMAYNNIGEVDVEQNELDTALSNFNIAFKIASRKRASDLLVAINNNLGNIYLKKDSLLKAENKFTLALNLATLKDIGQARCKSLLGLAKVKYKQGSYSEALKYGSDGLTQAQKMGQTQLMRDANQILAEIYEKNGNGMEALQHYKTYMIYADSLNNIANERAAANENANYRISQNKISFDKKSTQQKWIIFSAFAALVSLSIILWIINRNKKRLHKTYKDLQIKNELIETQKQEAEITLAQLKDTQSQLIQSEKMASLGELTAGIAHEIQNPLNFVNNFSEINIEMIEEMQAALAVGNTEEVISISNDIKDNEEKIAAHGKRAESIVRGMLQHSRTSTGKKESTNINALCEEYLNLSYHGLRAKDKSFNAKLKTDFDATVKNIAIVPQDIGRVLLNLYNNAFYAVAEKHRLAPSENNYEPIVSVSTRLLPSSSGRSHVEIKVTDNGNGIPQKVLEKIFLPFFTTKQTGQGTGLGLSMAYDIVRAHGGEIKAASKEGEGTEFTIRLPFA